MEKRHFIVFCLFLAALFAIPYCAAASMAGVSPSRIDIPFFPYAEQRIEFRTMGYDMADFEFKCPYVNAVNETVYDEDGVRTFSVNIKLPEKIEAEPGEYDCSFLLHRPTNPNAPAGVSASAEISVILIVHIPVKGKYAIINLNANNVNKGEPVFFKVDVQNLGDTTLNELSAIIDVMDIDGNIKETLHTTSSDVPPFKSVELWKRMETTNYEPAKYKAKATLFYGGEKPATAETEFLIGKLFVAYNGIELNATAGKINPVKINVESWWGNPIENVKAEVKIYDANQTYRSEFRTESVDLAPWQKASLQGYWDANGIEAGEYNANLTLLYKGGETKEKIKITVQKEPETEKESIGFKKLAEIVASPVFLALLILILIINVSMWLIKQKNQKREK